ncbi:MAG: hypothetical protein U5K74_07195 [Gemmatimonadaceae bacterium]|nr:hypothetical protein [Gemmatimonadaceae bacterium]
MTSSRRQFIASGGAWLAVATLPRRANVIRRPTVDVVLRGGTVFDGLGTDGREADVAISDDRITAIGTSLPEQGAARDRVPWPGRRARLRRHPFAR